MRLVRIIATMMVFASMVFIASCGEEKTASLEGHEDIVAVIQKIPQCYFKIKLSYHTPYILLNVKKKSRNNF